MERGEFEKGNKHDISYYSKIMFPKAPKELIMADLDSSTLSHATSVFCAACVMQKLYPIPILSVAMICHRVLKCYYDEIRICPI